MSGVLDEVPLGARVALIRLRSLGDCVLSTPAIALLKAARADLRLGVVVDDAWAAVYRGNSDVEVTLAPRIRALREWRAELVLNLHGGSRSAQLTAFSGARWRAGWRHFRWQALYNVRIPKAQEILGVGRTVHTAEHVASAVFALGVPVREVPRACLFAAAGVRRGGYAVIHAVASEAAKTWDAEKFCAVARFCRDQAGLEPVFLGAASDNLSAFREFEIAQGQGLAETMSLLQGAACFVGNDSGPAHLAAAFGVPCTVLFGPSDPAIWGPWRTQSTVLRASPISGIRVEDVVSSVRVGVRV